MNILYNKTFMYIYTNYLAPDGEKVVEESLRAIFEAERKAKEKIEAAQREASSVVESARKEAEKLKAGTKLVTKAKAQKIFDESRKKAESDVQELLKEARKQALAMERKVKERRAKAIRLVLDNILG